MHLQKSKGMFDQEVFPDVKRESAVQNSSGFTEDNPALRSEFSGCNTKSFRSNKLKETNFQFLLSSFQLI